MRGSEQGGAERCLVIHPHVKSPIAKERDPAARLDEIVGLALAIGVTVAHADILTLNKIKPSTLFGKGAVGSIAAIIAGEDIDIAVIDAALSPIQQRNLERDLDCKVIDRTGLILEIFGDRARTREGRLQVELAALTYQRSRLVRSWTHLERQRGGAGFMGGPGETQIETDRRQIDKRLTRLRRDLKEVKRTRDLHRKARRRTPYPIVALVGYTNAGKSTLFNRLTNAHVDAQDQLFATLDPTMRGIDLESGRSVILSDTVGFISDLPHELVTAFHATLEEVTEADIVIHVRDAAHPDTTAQKNDVLKVLVSLGLSDNANTKDKKFIEVLNKIDAVDPEQLEALKNKASHSGIPVIPVSALTGEGTPILLNTIDALLALSTSTHTIDVESTDGATLSWLYDHGEVIERLDDDQGVHVKVRLDDANWARFEQR
ncbi:MAG: GTPase HflX [Rhodospirillales bacterium]|nr:GTPase HflX [Rhodospirillales bacterium]